MAAIRLPEHWKKRYEELGYKWPEADAVNVEHCGLPDMKGDTMQRRELIAHQTSKLNRECINVFAEDEPASDGAHHLYSIEVRQPDQPKNTVPAALVHLEFQNGGLAEAGANGITEQALLAIVLDRYRCFQAGPYRCRENAIIITKLEESLMWMLQRADDRARRGVEGERKA